MKGIDLFCSSPASTAICASMDQRSMVRHGGRAIDRHNPHLIDGRRSTSLLPYSSQTQPPSKPKPYLHQKSRKSSATPTDLNTPQGSSRYLLSHDSSAFFDVLSDFDPPRELVLVQRPSKTQAVNTDQPPAFKQSSSIGSHNQVVVLRVSLHCKGCEGKVRKHISKMEGVTSFNIDFAAKKVTVVGDVTPLGVLASVSRVKKAQLWPSSSSLGPSYCEKQRRES
ncbi:PREDICTED: protein SODIUM POTASSIUM ROOT DEFECTIVE 2-like [Nelumbo nucifera]|uniref:HMA domain-containing protein n=2 Tax=Nelumbo nucifera TaxID=4432 RepID=A0A822Y1P8_NELNU|nr:PREDICTED: protein SODIUM POTASSIUM ROOT DEFECTIVE 2-like [Nelumbo nucifera]DAD27814.1 TPA_asm: hypothetical protein HUJ06_029282 [Nelumbo nucifera]